MVMRDGQEKTPGHTGVTPRFQRSRLGFAFGLRRRQPGPVEAARISADYVVRNRIGFPALTRLWPRRSSRPASPGWSAAARRPGRPPTSGPQALDP